MPELDDRLNNIRESLSEAKRSVAIHEDRVQSNMNTITELLNSSVSSIEQVSKITEKLKTEIKTMEKRLQDILDKAEELIDATESNTEISQDTPYMGANRFRRSRSR